MNQRSSRISILFKKYGVMSTLIEKKKVEKNYGVTRQKNKSHQRVERGRMEGIGLEGWEILGRRLLCSP